MTHNIPINRCRECDKAMTYDGAATNVWYCTNDDCKIKKADDKQAEILKRLGF